MLRGRQGSCSCASQTSSGSSARTSSWPSVCGSSSSPNQTATSPPTTIGRPPVSTTTTCRPRVWPGAGTSRSPGSSPFTTPPRPLILSPADGSELRRGQATLVRFKVGGQSTMFYITALGQGTKSSVYPFGDPPILGTRNPPTNATLDTNALAAGPDRSPSYSPSRLWT